MKQKLAYIFYTSLSVASAGCTEVCIDQEPGKLSIASRSTSESPVVSCATGDEFTIVAVSSVDDVQRAALTSSARRTVSTPEAVEFAAGTEVAICQLTASINTCVTVIVPAEGAVVHATNLEPGIEFDSSTDITRKASWVDNGLEACVAANTTLLDCGGDLDRCFEITADGGCAVGNADETAWLNCLKTARCEDGVIAHECGPEPCP
jgi:hypothetical protein